MNKQSSHRLWVDLNAFAQSGDSALHEFAQQMFHDAHAQANPPPPEDPPDASAALDLGTLIGHTTTTEQGRTTSVEIYEGFARCRCA